LAAPVIEAVLADARLEAQRVEALIVGNTTAGSNPARLVALLSGLGDGLPALTLDRQEASGLEAVLAAARLVAGGEASIVVAGGAESLSMAPWRIAKPRGLHQMPRFVGPSDLDDAGAGNAAAIEAQNALAQRLGISRAAQDETALASHIRAGLARDARRFVKEVVALKPRAEEARDEPAGDPDIEDLDGLPPLAGEGTLTAGNSSPLADGAAFLIVVSEKIHKQLGSPPALRLVDAVALGAAPAAIVEAPGAAARSLLARQPAAPLDRIARVELGETSAVQLLAFRRAMDIEDTRLNVDGGQIARGMPLGAASAVLLVRLYSALVRAEEAPASGSPLGLAVSGSLSGQIAAALVERVA
jgi:acetyl-CoA C-acetyltransferase